MDPEDEELPEEEGTVLSPGELELSEKEGVEQLEEGRFVISPDGTRPDVPTELSVTDADVQSRAREAADARAAADASTRDDDSTAGESASSAVGSSLNRAAVREWHATELAESPCPYGFHVSVKAGDAVDHHALHSDDVTGAFDDLLRRYARTVDEDLPPGAVIGILLTDATVPVQYPTKALEQFLMNRGLSTEDTLGDLLEAVRDDGGVVFPPRTE